MTDEQAAAIAARAEAATPGEWWHHGYYIYCGPRDAAISDRISNPNKLAHTRRYGNEKADAAFIAHARADIPALLSERAALLEIVRAVADATPRSRSTVFFHLRPMPDQPETSIEGTADTYIELDAEWREKARTLLAGDGEEQ